ncbi:hypothetical protein EXVG_00173 [Emiliania huxleyi virus 202]|nr:hypothetical protein EXVG_00173 [Emiliania huxleyi virus 202]
MAPIAQSIQKKVWNIKKKKEITIEMKVGDSVRWSAGVKTRFVRDGTISEILGPDLFVFETNSGQLRARPRGVSVINGKHVLDYP